MNSKKETLLPIGNDSLKTTNDPNSNAPLDTCEICGGLGYYTFDVPFGHPKFGKMFVCPHREAEVKQEKIEKVWKGLGPLKDMTFENFQPEGHGLTDEQRASLRNVYTWLYESTDNKTSSPPWIAAPQGWVLLQGGYGCGKTHLAAAIANACLRNDMDVIFTNVPDLLDYLRAAFHPLAEEAFDQRFQEVRDVFLLILDDLGAHHATPWAEEKLYQILNARYVNKLPTVITTNLEIDEFEPRLGSRLSDRSITRSWKIQVPDYRPGYSDRARNSASNLEYYQDMTFNSFEPRSDLAPDVRADLQRVLNAAKNYAQQPRGWLLLTGKYGVGKTHLAASIANSQVERNYPAVFVVVPDLLDHLRAAFSPEARTSFDQRFEEVRTASLLVLDDLGTESATPWAREKLYQIINYRYVAKLPTVITTAVSPDDLDPRIRTRLQDQSQCSVLTITAPSYRKGNDTPRENTQPLHSGRRGRKSTGSKY